MSKRREVIDILAELPREELINIFEQEVRRDQYDYDPLNLFGKQKYTLEEVKEALTRRVLEFKCLI